MPSKERILKFKESRTSWRYFQKRWNEAGVVNAIEIAAEQTRVQLEILKELQFIVDSAILPSPRPPKRATKKK